LTDPLPSLPPSTLLFSSLSIDPSIHTTGTFRQLLPWTSPGTRRIFKDKG
jgi:hypothetical protein